MVAGGPTTSIYMSAVERGVWRSDRRTKLDGFAKEEHVVGVVAAAVRIVWTE